MKKRLFKALSAIILILICSSMFTVFSSASNKTSLSVETVSAKPGDTVDVKINISNNPGIASLKVNVDYDDVLTLTDIKFNSDFGSYVTAPTPYKNPQTLSMISPTKDLSINGVFATLTFKVSAAVKGNYNAKISLKYDPDDICNTKMNNIPVNVVDGSINVAGTVTPQNCVVVFNANDGTNTSTKTTVSSKSSTRLPTLKKDGYTCVGWSEDKNAVLPTYKCGTDYSPKADTNLYAVWAKNNSKVTGVSVDNVTLHYKDTATVNADIKTVNNAKYVVKWESSNKDIATVDDNGAVTAVKRGSGTATITCTVTDQFGNTVKNSCDVSVSLTAWQWIKTYIFFGWIWY